VWFRVCKLHGGGAKPDMDSRTCESETAASSVCRREAIGTNLFSGDRSGPKWTLDVAVLHASLSELDRSDEGDPGLLTGEISLGFMSMVVVADSDLPAEFSCLWDIGPELDSEQHWKAAKRER
jgi:hypothetical protein